ncbi:AAA family ATPase [Wenjunlia tyrosinilytica]|uniref:Uncharacterized protein n=1 Tax=Wenjunlia tyrosinilytica TaxID=1544741 RepID=A0A917ZFA3_9ACTN|nr:AAA family ATPase [Wenjunlia tyrosinilytica]GGO82325.1 hypothetical protein GCM10012280_08660 [Wenjunlia tyrosinilytica]
MQHAGGVPLPPPSGVPHGHPDGRAPRPAEAGRPSGADHRAAGAGHRAGPGPLGSGYPGPTGQPPTPQPTSTGHFPLPPPSTVQLPTPPPPPTPTPTPTPQHQPGTTAPIAVLLIGPAGAGKTTIARHWADRRPASTAHISLDDVREWVRSGFADPQSGWNEHSEAQYRLARRTCGFAARNFLANGISCIIDDAVFPDRPVVGLGGWKRHVGPGLLPVVLLPGLEVVLARNAERSGNRRLSDEEVARIHGRMAGWYGSGLPIIDNSQLDVATAAEALDRVVARSVVGPPVW